MKHILSITILFGKFAFLLLLTAVVLPSCQQSSPPHEHDVAPGNKPGSIQYATGFRVEAIGNARLVEVTQPFPGATSGYRYLLVPKDEQPPPHDEKVKVIFTPLESIVCTSTTHIPLLDYLGETDKLVGFPTTDYISSEKMRARIEAGGVEDLGIDKGLNIERLAMLAPDVVMGYTMSSDYGQFAKIEAMGIPVVINAEYLEQHPLGRAEWIKFTGLFFGREREADSVFQFIADNYHRAKASLPEDSGKRTVLSGVVYGDAWFLPAGGNYQARLFRDAGCSYFWADSPGTGFLELSFESVYEKAHDTDLWIGTGPYSALDDIASADHRYTGFKAFRNKMVYNYDARMGSKGGNEFLELGYLRPDLILLDLVSIAHPGSVPGHQLFFHRKLE